MSYLEGHIPGSPLSSQSLLETTSPGTAWRTAPPSPQSAGAPGCRSACSPRRSAQNPTAALRSWTWTIHGFYAIYPPLTLGRLVLLSMMKIQSFPFRLWAALYFLTNARFSVVAPPAASPPRAPWVMIPRMVLGTPKSTCGCQVQTKHLVMFYCSRPSCLSSSNNYGVHYFSF